MKASLDLNGVTRSCVVGNANLPIRIDSMRIRVAELPCDTVSAVGIRYTYIDQKGMIQLQRVSASRIAS